MADEITPTPEDDLPVSKRADRVPDPHAGEPLPPAEEGMRPGVDPAVRPAQDEPLGPAAGLVTASMAQADEEASEVVGADDPEAEALLAQMGVEEENIESGQLLGLVAAVLFSVAALAVVLIYLFYVPLRTQVGIDAEGEAEATDLAILEAEATAKLTQYRLEGETYGVPIGRAMAIVAAEDGAGPVPGLPDDRADWNLLPVYGAGPGRAVQDVADRAQIDAPEAPDVPLATTDEEVGVDRDVDEVEVVDDDDPDIE